ncbi:hypothetical protein AB1N83_009971 [Pleurotus pulmonarius]
MPAYRGRLDEGACDRKEQRALRWVLSPRTSPSLPWILSILDNPTTTPTVDALTAEAKKILPELPEGWDDAVGEVVRAPFADLPNTAAFLGGVVAQEVIKMITKQYVAINGYCVADLVDSWTGVMRR